MHIYFGVNRFAPNTCPVLVMCRGVNLLETKGYLSYIVTYVTDIWSIIRWYKYTF